MHKVTEQERTNKVPACHILMTMQTIFVTLKINPLVCLHSFFLYFPLLPFVCAITKRINGLYTQLLNATGGTWTERVLQYPWELVGQLE